jgi:hypothetical protein
VQHQPPGNAEDIGHDALMFAVSSSFSSRLRSAVRLSISFRR